MKFQKIGNILVEIEKKKIKNMYLRVLPPEGRVHISAPMKMSDEAIIKFVLSKTDWIEEQQIKLKQLVVPALQYETGEFLSLWGKQYQLEVITVGSREKIILENDKIVLQVRAGSTILHREKLIQHWYKEMLHDQIPILISKWEKIIGVNINEWYVRDMKTCWGTCNVIKKKICLNLQLAKKPQQYLEYVVVHELVHLLEKSHNHIFKGYLDHFLPEWRRLRAELNCKTKHNNDI